jgi:hypothetical protein
MGSQSPQTRCPSLFNRAHQVKIHDLQIRRLNIALSEKKKKKIYAFPALVDLASQGVLAN